MSQHDTVALARTSLAHDLRNLGVRPGQCLLVHASLRRIGAEGGAGTVTDALRDALGPEGTIVVVTATPDNSTTSRAHLAATGDMGRIGRWRYRRKMPAFNPATTPSTGMGALAEYIRTSPHALRSGHPQTSFAALGPEAGEITRYHAEDCHYGERSPLAVLYEIGASILLLGVGYAACTALHLAEYRYTMPPPTRRYRCVVERNGRRRWWSYKDVVLDDQDFAELGEDLDERPDHVARGPVGGAESRLIPLRKAVDFAEVWLQHRRGT